MNDFNHIVTQKSQTMSNFHSNCHCVQEMQHNKQDKIDINEAHVKYGHVSEKMLRKTLRKIGIIPIGVMDKCKACAMSKAKHKAVKKFTLV